MMAKVTVVLKDLKKRSGVYRKAAEVIQRDLESEHELFRDGCCGAFYDVLMLARVKVFKGKSPFSAPKSARDNYDDVFFAVNSAEVTFAEMFRPENYKLYWFGRDFTKEQQEHRITALLLMADIAESEGD